MSWAGDWKDQSVRVDCDVNVNGFIACEAVQINTYFVWLGTRIMGPVQNVSYITSLPSLLCKTAVSYFKYIVDWYNIYILMVIIRKSKYICPISISKFATLFQICRMRDIFVLWQLCSNLSCLQWIVVDASLYWYLLCVSHQCFLPSEDRKAEFHVLQTKVQQHISFNAVCFSIDLPTTPLWPPFLYLKGFIWE